MSLMQPGWKAGIATTIITPAESMWLAGWAVRTGPSRATLTELYAKALALEDHQGSRLVVLTLDLIAVSRALASAVADQVWQQCGLPRDRLMICASHTHSGPEIRPDKVPFFHIPAEYARKIPAYQGQLTLHLVQVVVAAIGSIQPVHLRACQTTASFACNRRGDAAVDHDVPVLEVASVEGPRRAVLFGFGCHNTTMAPEDGRYCGDYAGFAQAALEQADPETTALFIAGAGADQDPAPRGTVELARIHGQTLADSVRQRLVAARFDDALGGSLRVAYDEVPLEFSSLPERDVLMAERASEDRPVRTKAEYLLSRLDRGETFEATYPCPIQVARLGNALLLVAIGGEPVIDYAQELKRRYGERWRIVWVAGYANDMFGYVPTARVLREGGYEGRRSVLWSTLPAPFAENTEERVINEINRLVEQLGEDG